MKLKEGWWESLGGKMGLKRLKDMGAWMGQSDRQWSLVVGLTLDQIVDFSSFRIYKWPFL